jgi:hypothetical protein
VISKSAEFDVDVNQQYLRCQLSASGEVDEIYVLQNISARRSLIGLRLEVYIKCPACGLTANVWCFVENKIEWLVAVVQL